MRGRSAVTSEALCHWCREPMPWIDHAQTDPRNTSRPELFQTNSTIGVCSLTCKDRPEGKG